MRRIANTAGLLAAMLLVLPVVVKAQLNQFNYTTNNGTLTVSSFTGPGGALAIPGVVNLGTFSKPYYLPVTGIASNAFNNGYFHGTVTSVTIPSSITNIIDGAFYNCIFLTGITVNSTNPAYSSLNGILFDKNQTILIQWPTANGGSYVIPNSVSSIGDGAFEYCSKLASITIPNGVSSIGDDVFWGCTGLTNIIIPDTVTNIGDEAFGDCTGMTTFLVDTNNNFFSSVAGVLFDKNLLTLLAFPAGADGSYAIPGSVTSIKDNAFNLCGGLANITIPDSVTNIGFGAFQLCINLTNISIGINVTSIGDFAFYNCNSLPSVTIPDSVTNLGVFAFYECIGLTNASIGSGVTSIGDETFDQCNSLRSLTVGNGITNIFHFAFSFCDNLTSIYFKGDAPTADSTLFIGDSLATVYYLPGTMGWDSTFSGAPTVLWNPQAQTGDGSFGVQNNQFGFNIAGSSNLVIVVEAATNLTSPAWIPVGTNTLNTFVGTNGTSYFSDLQWTNYPSRFYRFRSP
jgi:hypothetical protein